MYTGYGVSCTSPSWGIWNRQDRIGACRRIREHPCMRVSLVPNLNFVRYNCNEFRCWKNEGMIRFVYVLVLFRLIQAVSLRSRLRDISATAVKMQTTVPVIGWYSQIVECVDTTCYYCTVYCGPLVPRTFFWFGFCNFYLKLKSYRNQK